MPTQTDLNQQKFYVTDGKSVFGPMIKDAVLREITAGKINFSDYIRLENQAEWQVLANCDGLWDSHGDLEFLDFSKYEENSEFRYPANDQAGARPGPANPTVLSDITDAPTLTFVETFNGSVTAINNPQVVASETSEWYFQKHRTFQGPHTFLNILGFLQDGTLQDSDLIQSANGNEWSTIRDTPEFSADSITAFRFAHRLMEPMNVHFRRKDPRFSFRQNILVSHQDQVLNILCLDISKGGLSLMTRTDRFKLNDTVLLRLRSASTGDSPSGMNSNSNSASHFNSKGFDAKGVVVSTRNVTAADQQQIFFAYGVAFKEITKATYEWLIQLVGR